MSKNPKMTWCKGELCRPIVREACGRYVESPNSKRRSWFKEPPCYIRKDGMFTCPEWLRIPKKNIYEQLIEDANDSSNKKGG